MAGKPLAKEKQKAIRVLRQQGFTINKIVCALEVSEPTVIKYLKVKA